jgi:hypothetical protein
MLMFFSLLINTKKAKLFTYVESVMLRYDKVFLDKHQLVRHHDLELGKLPSDCFQYLHIIRTRDVEYT